MPPGCCESFVHTLTSDQACRYMFDPDGTFNDNHINNWQHAAMYLGYMVAGVVDIAAHFTDLPADCGQARPAATPAP